jgi:hypothetical protein
VGYFLELSATTEGHDCQRTGLPLTASLRLLFIVVFIYGHIIYILGLFNEN